jgi:hypothetical protein
MKTNDKMKEKRCVDNCTAEYNEVWMKGCMNG